MRSVLIILAVAAAVAIGWVALGRSLSLLVDRVSTVRVAVLPVKPILYANGTLQIAERAIWFVSAGSGDSAAAMLWHDDRGHVAVVNGGKSFSLGAESAQGLVPDENDEVSFTIERSRLSWPTPLEMNFMTGVTPSWKRHLYYRLVWKKRSGAKLQIVSRFEQWFYASNGWTGLGGMTSLKTSGAPAVGIVP